MRDLDILAYIQPVFIQSDMDMAEDRIGDRIRTSYNWRTLVDLGVRQSIWELTVRRGYGPYRQYLLLL